MLSGLKKTLAQTQKYKLWQESYIFSLCQESVKKWLDGNQEVSINEIKIFVKSTSKTVVLKITSNNTTLISWLKINQESLFNHINNDLNSREILTNRKLELSFKMHY